MKLQKILISLLLLLLTLGLIHVAPAQADSSTSQQVKSIQKRGVLNVGVKQDVPNFGYLNPDSNTYSGLEIDIAKKIAEIAGHIDCDIQPCHSNEFPSQVIRPAYSVLDKTKIKETFGIRIPYWTDSLKKCMAELV